MKILSKLLFELARLLFKSKQDLILENLMLRQQLNIYKRKDKKPKIENIDRMILVWMSKLLACSPKTVPLKVIVVRGYGIQADIGIADIYGAKRAIRWEMYDPFALPMCVYR